MRIAGPHSLQDLILERHALGIVLLEPSFRGVDICKHLYSLQDLILERHALGIVLLEPSFRGVDICKHL